LCSQAGLAPTKTNIFNLYVQRVRTNLHVVLAFSPLGEEFGKRILMFPALINNCTIDWFSEWPTEALYNVAKQQLGGGVDSAASENNVLDSLPNVDGVLKQFSLMHKTVEKGAVKFLDETKRCTYVTPTSYLELLSTFMKVLEKKRKDVGTMLHRFQSGLDKLASAEEQTKTMEEELTALQPVLKQTSEEVAELMIVITADKKVAEETYKRI